MPSNKEILEAQRYNRRRLITAFTSGIPGGRELESKSPFIPLIVGAVIVTIMLGVGVVMSRFAPTLPQNWQNSTLIVVKDSGARYFTINGVLRPVTNVTSARLLTESGDLPTSEIPSSTIEGIRRGSQIGITDVPDDVPPVDQLHSDQWFSCDISGTPHTWVAQLPEARTARGNVLVNSQGEQFLIANGLKHRIPSGQNPNPVYALGLDSVTPVEVSSQWLSLFETGSDLKFLQLEGAGLPVREMPDSLRSAVVGTVIQIGDDSSRRYVITGDKKAAQLKGLAEKLYETGDPVKVSLNDLSQLSIDAAGIAPSDWPQNVEDTMPGGSVPCAQLVKTSNGDPTSALYSMTSESASDALPKTQNSDTAADGASNTPPPTSVRGGSGALIRATSGGSSLGPVMLVSDLGTLHGLGTKPETTLPLLRYSADQVTEVPSTWTELIPEGASLDPDSVWATVKQQ